MGWCHPLGSEGVAGGASRGGEHLAHLVGGDGRGEEGELRLGASHSLCCRSAIADCLAILRGARDLDLALDGHADHLTLRELGAPDIGADCLASRLVDERHRELHGAGGAVPHGGRFDVGDLGASGREGGEGGAERAESGSERHR